MVNLFQAKGVLKDADVGVGAAAAAAIIVETGDRSETVQLAGVVIAGVIVAVTVLGRLVLRSRAVTAAGYATAHATADDDSDVAAVRDVDLVQILIDADAEQGDDNTTPPSLDLIDEIDGADDGE